MKQRVNHLRVFGCVAYRHIVIQNLQKFDKRAQMGSFVGYSQDSMAYIIYIPNFGKVIINRDVLFIENEVWNWA